MGEAAWVGVEPAAWAPEPEMMRPSLLASMAVASGSNPAEADSGGAVGCRRPPSSSSPTVGGRHLLVPLFVLFFSLIFFRNFCGFDLGWTFFYGCKLDL
jgi:hypothetical protein